MNPLWYSCKRCGRKGLFRLDKLRKAPYKCRLCGAEYTDAPFAGTIAIAYGTVAAYPIMLAFFLPCFETIALLLVTGVIGLAFLLFYPIR